MAFEGLSEKLQNAFKDLKGQGVVSEKDFNDAMRVVKMALLEADVNFKVVNNSTTTVNNWTLKIKKSDLTVDNCWCVKVAEEGEYYVFTPETWNSTIGANGNATFGLNGSGSIGNTLNFILL